MAGPVHPRLLQRAEATRGYLVASVVVGVATAGLVVVQAWLIARAVTTVFEARALPDDWPRLLGGLGVVFALRAALAWLNQVLAHRSAAAVKSQLRRDVLAARAARPLGGGTSSATLVGLVTTGLDALDGYFSKYLPQLGLAATVPFVVGSAILLADWPSAVIVAVTLPLIPVFMALIGWTTQAATRRSYRTADRLANHFADLIAGLPTLQAFARARAQRAGIELTEGRYRAATMRVLYVSFLSAFALELLATLSVAVVAVTVGFRLVDGGLTFFAALFVLVLAPEAYLPVRQVGVHFHDSVDGVAAADAAFAIIDGAGEALPGGAAGSGADAGPLLRFDQVSFRHGPDAEPVLQGLDLAVEEGEVVALTGPSGGGKSTVLNLLMGYLTPDAGRVLGAGHDLSTADPAAWRRQVAWVAQEPGLVNGTVADNVLLGDPDATPAAVAEALRQAGADFGPDKRVGDDGEGLSGGERRRVAIARALLRVRSGGVGLFVLDEPTAGLDRATESAVVDAVRASGVAALIVTHRPAVLAACDRIVDLAPAKAGRDG